MTPELPFRDTFWNVPLWAQIALYTGGVIALAIFARGVEMASEVALGRTRLADVTRAPARRARS